MDSSVRSRNLVLDEIMANRHSVRTFTEDSPSRDEIEAVIAAGRLAPFAQLSVMGKSDYRKFVVVSKSSPIMPTLTQIATARMKDMLTQLEIMMKTDEYFRDNAGPFHKMISAFAETGVPGIGNAPYYVVVAERKGIPDNAQQSIAHCLQNMWLKATALGLGFHLVSATSNFGGDKEFCDLLNIPYGQYRLDGCAIGYPKVIHSSKRIREIPSLVTWL